MENCIFCKIVKGEISSTKIFEDENFLAFLDIRPISAGHTLVIPKNHIRWVWDLPAGRQVGGNIGEYFEVVQKIAKAEQKAFGVELIQSKIVGDEVAHAHIWLFPDPSQNKFDKKDFAGNAKKLKKILSI